MGIPLRADLGEVARMEHRAFQRAAASHVVSALGGNTATATHRRLFGETDDARRWLTIRAASSPADTTSAAAITQTRVAPLALLTPTSAAGKLFGSCARVSFGNRVLSYTVPSVSTQPIPLFTAEGGPIPVVQPSLTSTTIGPPRRMAFAVVVTNEILLASGPDAATMIGDLLARACALPLDSAVFGTAAASSAQPAGLLHGVTPITATVAGTRSSIDTAASDLANIAEAFGAAGIDDAGLILITTPQLKWHLAAVFGYRPDLTVLSSPAIATDQLIALAPRGIYSGYSGDAEIDTSIHPTMHMEGATPLPVGSAAPASSAFQQDLVTLRVRLWCAWAALPGAVQVVNGVNW
jgi:hypothetical protein